MLILGVEDGDLRIWASRDTTARYLEYHSLNRFIVGDLEVGVPSRSILVHSIGSC